MVKNIYRRCFYDERLLSSFDGKKKKEKPKGGTKENDKLIRRLEREIEKQEAVVAEFDAKIEAASADYQELTRLLGEKEEAEMILMDLMEQWEAAQAAMGKILDNLGVKYEIGIDEAAFYGPKLDIQYKNVFGKEDTIVTIQIDMLLAQKFGMEYTDSDGQKKTPYIIHRTSLGCYERTLAYLIERYAGALPLWMMPTQVKVLPITDRAHEYAKELSDKLNAMNIHAETDCRSEKLGYKIREAQMQKIPYMLVIGDRDMENGTVSVRTRKGEDLGAMTPDAFIAKCLMEIATKSKEV